MMRLKICTLNLLTKFAVASFFTMLPSGCQLASHPEVFSDERLLTKRISELSDLSHQLKWEVAHRGAQSVAPGNTIAALVAAAKLNVPMIEFDIRASADGELFLYHDRRIDAAKFVDALPLNGKIFSSLSSAKIRSLRYSDKTNAAVCSLREALSALRPYPVIILPEIKEFDAAKFEAFVAELRAQGFYDRAVLQCASDSMTKTVTKLSPLLKIAVRVFNEQQLLEALKLKPAVVQIDEDWMTSRLVGRAHQSGTRILVKTLDKLGDTEIHRAQLFMAGVDLVLTDWSLSTLAYRLGLTDLS